MSENNLVFNLWSIWNTNPRYLVKLDDNGKELWRFEIIPEYHG